MTKRERQHWMIGMAVAGVVVWSFAAGWWARDVADWVAKFI